MQLLVGYDGSPGGHDALELARVVADATGAGALVVTVLPYGPLPIAHSPLDGEQAAATEPLFAEARRALTGIEVEARGFGGGSPAGVINDLAEEEEVEMIVVGSPHRGAIGRALIGSVAEGLLHGAPCVVVVAPRGYAEDRHDRFRLIGVAYDGTPEAKVALARAEGLARAINARLRVLTVSSPPAAVPGAAGYTPSIPPDAEEVNRAGASAVGRDLGVERQVLSGPTVAALSEACEDGVELLVAGSRRYGPVARALIGSVTSKLIHTAPCPVLVEPRP